MATAAAAAKNAKDIVFEYEGKDKTGKIVRGEIRAGGEAMVSASLRRQGILITKVKKRRMSGGKAIKQKDIAVFTRQLSTMMRAGVPLIQSFDIVARGSPNPRLTKLLTDIRSDVETGTSLSSAFRKHPLYFDALYCNLVEAGEAGGILETLLDRLAVYQEKTMAIKNKIKSALIYPVAVLVVAFVVLAVIMIFVIPAFKDVFSSFGADLPAPTLVVIALSEFFVKYWWAIFGFLGGGVYFFIQSLRRSEKMQKAMDRLLLRVPVFGELINKSAVARWTRTLSTMFAAGVPLVEALDSVGGASGNAVFAEATEQIQKDVSTGASLTNSMQTTGVFPNMVLQMCSIGEESGSLDQMLGKAAEFYEDEVDEAVKGLSSLMEPFIIVILGTMIGGIVVSMYLPIFKLGQVVWNGWPELGGTLLSPWVLALFGVLIGSFLNVVVHRLPLMLERGWKRDSAELLGVPVADTPAITLSTPRSRCPSCGHSIAWHENIPLISYLRLGGKCSACKAPISPRYPLVELATGALFAAIGWQVGAQPAALLWCAFAAVLVALAGIDWDTTLLPDDLTLPLLWGGLTAAALGWTIALPQAVWGAVAGYLSLWSVYWLFKLATGKEGMGHGDFKLLAALGAWLGVSMIVPMLLAASVIGALVGIAMKAAGGLREGRYVPFGPFLAGAGLAVMFAGQPRVLGWLAWT